MKMAQDDPPNYENQLIYCKTCLTTNLRPNSAAFIDGICIPCQYSKEMQEASLQRKQQNLSDFQKLLAAKKKRRRKKSQYDCIVGVSGGKDSTRQAHWVRDRLGLHPLLICAGYPPIQTTYIGAKNLSNLVDLGFDLMVVTPAPRTAARFSLETFQRFGNVSKASEMSLFSTVPRLAIDLKIDLILWGENPALQVGDHDSLGQNQFDGNQLRKMNTLASGLDWLDEVAAEDYLREHYKYPTEAEFEENKIDIYFLGTVWDDWENSENACYGALTGLTLRPFDEMETGDISNASMLDEEFTNINMMIKYYKYGFGRATDILNEKIRAGSISREEAIKIAAMFDGTCSDRIIERYCDFVSISVEKFWEILNCWVNRDLFAIQNNHLTRPRPKFEIGYPIEN